MAARPRAGLDRQAVIQAAATLADESGHPDVSLTVLAGRLGVRTPTLYHYVDGQPGLRRELALLALRELSGRLGQAIMGQAGPAALAGLAHAYRRFVNEHPGLYAATVAAAGPADPELEAAQTEIVEIALTSLSGYRLSRGNALHQVRILRSLVHGFATLEQAGGFGLPLSLDETFTQLVTLFLDNLAQPGPS